MMENQTMQLVFIDLLFLFLVGGMGWWIRAWLRLENQRMDERLEDLKKHQEDLEKLAERLSVACRTIERTASSLALPSLGDSPASVPPPRRSSAPRTIRRPDVPPSPPRVTEPSQDKEWEKRAERSRDAYRLARELLEQGMSTTDVARQVGLGIAEVNVLKRMRDAAR